MAQGFAADRFRTVGLVLELYIAFNFNAKGGDH
jgi:hypothetical protein